MDITANTTLMKSKIYRLWKDNVLPKNIHDKDLLDKLYDFLPNSWESNGRLSFHHFTNNFPEGQNRLICEKPMRDGIELKQRDITKMIMENDERLIAEMNEVIVVPTYLHNAVDIKADDMEDAYLKYFAFSERYSMSLEIKRFSLCLRSLEKVKEDFRYNFKDKNSPFADDIMNDFDEIISKVKDFIGILENNLNNTKNMRDMNDFFVM